MITPCPQCSILSLHITAPKDPISKKIFLIWINLYLILFRDSFICFRNEVLLPEDSYRTSSHGEGERPVTDDPQESMTNLPLSMYLRTENPPCSVFPVPSVSHTRARAPGSHLIQMSGIQNPSGLVKNSLPGAGIPSPLPGAPVSLLL